MILRRFLVALILFLAMTEPAHAGPLVALIPVVVGKIAASVVLKLILTAVLTVAASALSRALKPKSQNRPAGLQIEQTLTGGVNSRTILVGQYATAGSQVTPAMSHGADGKTPNAFLTYVVALCDLPVDDLVAVMINGEYCSLSNTGNQYGFDIGGKYAGYAWLQFYDGTQTSADPMLINKYGSYVRPWQADRIGKGVAYAILTFKFNQDIFKGEPTFKFVLRGIKFYDPRKDSSVGGSGAHRYDNPATWEFTENNIVMAYNVLRGIDFPDGTRWGGESTADDLPLANWVAGMNVCDESIDTLSGPEPRYRAAYEIILGEDQPADILEELLKACSGSMSEVGGIYKVRVGPPSLPVAYYTDEDFLVSKDQDFNPYPSVSQSKNVLYASYPNPDEGYVAHDAPRIANDTYIAQDDGQEFPATIQLPTVPYATQVQRLMLGWLNDDRRWRQHGATFGHYGFLLEPLDAISWTSARNGYADKLFEISSVTNTLLSLNNTVAMREVDPSDYDWDSDDELPDPATTPTWDLPAPQAVPGFAVSPYLIKDNANSPRRVAIRAVWTPDAAEDANGLKIQVRDAATEVSVTERTVTNVTDGECIISDGIVPNNTYECRAMYIGNRTFEWTSWLDVSTGNLKLDERDLNIDTYLFEGLELTPDGILTYQGDIIGQVTAEGIGLPDPDFLDDISKQLDENAIATLQSTLVAQRVRTDTREAIGAARQDLSVKINDDLEVQVSARLELAAKVDQNSASLLQEQSLRVSADFAIAADIEILQTDVNGNTAMILTQAAALSTLNGSVATLSSTVSTQGASITSSQIAITNLEGDMAVSFARVALRLDVNGYVTGWETNNNGTTSDFTIVADNFSIIKPSGGARTEFANGAWKVYDGSGVVRVQMGDLSV